MAPYLFMYIEGVSIAKQRRCFPMFKKLLSVGLALIIAVPFCTPVFAEDLDIPADDPVIEEYTYVSDIDTRLAIKSGNAIASVTVTDMNYNTTKIHVKMTLQKKSGASWSNVVTWEKTTTNNRLYLSKSKSVSSGTYRVKCVTNAYKNKLNESIPTYSVNVTY